MGGRTHIEPLQIRRNVAAFGIEGDDGEDAGDGAGAVQAR